MRDREPCVNCGASIDTTRGGWVPVSLMADDERIVCSPRCTIANPAMQSVRETFECIGGPLDGEFRPAPLSSTPFKGGVYCLDDTPRGAHWTWVAL